MKVFLPPDGTLAAPSTVQRLARAWKETGISRRRVLDRITDVIWNTEINVFEADGHYVRLLLIDPDTVFRTDADPSMRWYSDFLNWADTPPTRPAQGRVIERLKVLFMTLAINKPELMEKYGLPTTRPWF